VTTAVTPVRLVAHHLTPGQLDAALEAAGWPTWTSRDTARRACPLTLAEVPHRARAHHRGAGIGLGLVCLRADPEATGADGDWQHLLVELAAVAPEVITDVLRRGLIWGEPAPGEGVARFLLSVGVAQ
jgi:hypothetical protein